MVQEDLFMSELDRGTDRAGRRKKRFLSPSQKYEIGCNLVAAGPSGGDDRRGGRGAAGRPVDRSTILRIRQVAKEGALAALAALAASKPGVKSRERDYELEQAKAEVARLSEACKELAVKLTLVEGKDGWG